MDASTDSANIDKVFFVTWYNTNQQDQIVYNAMSYVCVARPKKVDGQRLFDCVAQV